MRRFVFFLLFSFILQIGSLSLAEDGDYLYDSHGRRDPFVPLVGITATAASSLDDVLSIEDVKFQGIASDASGMQVAILNGEMIREGERSGRVTLKNISNESIIILIDDEQYEISLYFDKKIQ
jgi:hypothetical protein